MICTHGGCTKNAGHTGPHGIQQRAEVTTSGTYLVVDKSKVPSWFLMDGVDMDDVRALRARIVKLESDVESLTAERDRLRELWVDMPTPF